MILVMLCGIQIYALTLKNDTHRINDAWTHNATVVKLDTNFTQHNVEMEVTLDMKEWILSISAVIGAGGLLSCARFGPFKRKINPPPSQYKDEAQQDTSEV